MGKYGKSCIGRRYTRPLGLPAPFSFFTMCKKEEQMKMHGWDTPRQPQTILVWLWTRLRLRVVFRVKFLLVFDRRW